MVEQRELDWPVRVRSVTPDVGSDGPSWHLIPADDPALVEYRRSDDEVITKLRFEGLIPPSGHHQALDDLSARLRSLRRGVQWLHGNRTGAPRELRLSGEGAPELLEPDGSNALVKLFMEKSELLPLVASFYAQPGVGLDLRLASIRTDAIQPLMNPPTRAEWGIALADVGEGMSKVLPVLVAAAAAVQGKGPSIVAADGLAPIPQKTGVPILPFSLQRQERRDASPRIGGTPTLIFARARAHEGAPAYWPGGTNGRPARRVVPHA